MPYKFEKEKIRLPRKLDRRVKLTEADKKKIRALHKREIPIREIARRFIGRCSRRMIQFILFPDRYEAAKEGFKTNRADGRYYNRKKHTKAVRDYRRYKKRIVDGEAG